MPRPILREVKLGSTGPDTNAFGKAWLLIIRDIEREYRTTFRAAIMADFGEEGSEKIVLLSFWIDSFHYYEVGIGQPHRPYLKMYEGDDLAAASSVFLGTLESHRKM